jgi:hypothetical protein
MKVFKILLKLICCICSIIQSWKETGFQFLNRFIKISSCIIYMSNYYQEKNKYMYSIYCSENDIIRYLFNNLELGF